MVQVAFGNTTKDELILYPNPANTWVQIDLPSTIDSSQPVEVTLFNNLGQQVLFTKLSQSFLDIADLPQGIYLVQVHQSAEVVSGQLIKF